MYRRWVGDVALSLALPLCCDVLMLHLSVPSCGSIFYEWWGSTRRSDIPFPTAYGQRARPTKWVTHCRHGDRAKPD